MTKKSNQPSIEARHIAERLKKAREQAGLSQVALSEKAGLSRSAVIHYEKGNAVPGGQELIKLAKALRRSPNFILGGDDSFFDSESVDHVLARSELPDDVLIQRIAVCLMILSRDVREKISALLMGLVRDKLPKSDYAEFLKGMSIVKRHVDEMAPTIEAMVDAQVSDANGGPKSR